MKEKTAGIVIFILFVFSIIMSFVVIYYPVPSKQEESKVSIKERRRIFRGATFYPANTIAVLNIFSVIRFNEEGDIFGIRTAGATYWLDLLKSIENEPNVKAVIIRINSPGGTVGAVQEIYNEILRLRNKGKVVTVSIGDIAASGAYYISCACDYIVANPGSLVGSIGVIMSGLDLTELFRKIGIGYNVIKSGKNKDIFASYRKMTEEEYKLLSDIIIDTYEQFFQAVSSGRNIKSAVLRPLADGRIFNGRQALKYKLIDELGDFDDTIKITAKLANISGTPNIMELKPDVNTLIKLLSSSFEGLGKSKKINLIDSPFDKFKEGYSPLLYLYYY